jgi:hypothetical protein
MLRNMDAALAMILVAREPEAPWTTFASHAPPDIELPRLARAELEARYKAGEVDADDCERVLAFAARMRAVLDVAAARGSTRCGTAIGSRSSGTTSTTTPARCSTSARPPPASS